MKIVRVAYQGQAYHGVLAGDEVFPITGQVFASWDVGKQGRRLDELEILAPIVPVNVLAIGLNYKRHAQETQSELPDHPLLFIKATSSVIGPKAPIVLPKAAPGEVDYEAELAIVIGKVCRNVSEREAPEYILGYTCANDVSARDCQKRIDKQWARAKSFDTFCPLGPWIVTDVDPSQLGIASRISGEVMQDSNTADMIFSPHYLVSYLSRNFTLLPGTVILTGTPEGVGAARRPPRFLRPGDTVEIAIQGLGILENPVMAEV